MGANLISEPWQYVIYEFGARFDGFYCFVRVANSMFVVRDENERIMLDPGKKFTNSLRDVVSDANEDRIPLKMLQLADVMTFMLADVESALVHARHCTRMHVMPSQ